MASAIRTPVRVVQPPDEITLTLTVDEAQAVRDALAFVGGNPDTSRRGLINSVSEALGKVGINYTYYAAQDITRKGGIEFKDTV